MKETFTGYYDRAGKEIYTNSIVRIHPYLDVKTTIDASVVWRENIERWCFLTPSTKRVPIDGYEQCRLELIGERT